jgi:hypothetical protein
MDQRSDSALVPLSALLQLTSLHIRGRGLRAVPLQHLQLPQLQHLHTDLGDNLTGRVQEQQFVKLAQFISLTQLWLSLRRDVLEPLEQLPPNLQELTLCLQGGGCSNVSSYSLQALLALGRLQTLQLCMRDAVPAAEALREQHRLSSVSNLTEVVAALSVRRVVEAYLKGGLLTNDQHEAQRKLL